MITSELLNLSKALGDKLIRKGWLISCAESCTAGGIGYAITSAPGSSEWFEQGFITYSNPAKQNQVGVSAEDLDTYGAVSEPVVSQMVQGAANNAGAQVAVAVSGIAGPGGGSEEKPVGLVWFGFKIADRVMTEKQVFDGDRDQIRQQTILYAMTRLVEEL